VERSII